MWRRYQYGPTGEVLFDQVFDHTVTTPSQSETDLLILLGDHQHSTRVVLAHDSVDATYVEQTIDYAQFGRITAIRNSAGALEETTPGVPGLIALDTAFTHHGSITEVRSRLQYKSHRWYSPDLGRFISEDPIQEGTNWYMAFGNNPVVYADPTGLSLQGHPLAGGYSGNVTRQPTIKPGNLPGAVSNNFLSTAVNSIGNAVGRGLGALAGALTPSRATPVAKPLSINDFSLSKDPGSLSRVHRPEALPSAPILNQVMEGYFNAYARNENFQRAVDGIEEQKKSLHLINRGTPLEAFSAQLDLSLSHAAGGLYPGVGEYQDVEMLVGRDSTKGQRALAAGSLALSLITLGESPNASMARRGTGVIDTHTVQELLDAQRYTHQIDVLPNSQVLSQIDTFGDLNVSRLNSAGQPINARGQFVKGAGGDSVAAQAGRNAHANFNALVDAKPGWTSQPRIRDADGRLHIPDATSPSGRAVELKPDTPSGIKAGQRQINRYNGATGQGGRVLYYDPVTGNIRFPFSEQ